MTYRVDTVERSYANVHGWLARRNMTNWRRAAEFALASEHAGLPIPYVSRIGDWCVRLVFESGATDAVVEFISESLVFELLERDHVTVEQYNVTVEQDHVTVEQDNVTVDIWSDLPVCESVARIKWWMK